MSLLISTRAELLKTKKSGPFWLSLIGAAVIPLIFLIAYLARPDKSAPMMQVHPWEIHFSQAYQAFASFLLPMFVILICSQIPQIEYKNNSWKQVFASPQSIGNIFFSKLSAILLMILFLFFMFNLFLVLVAVTANLVHSEFAFFRNAVDWKPILKLNVKTFVSLLGIIALQYWMSLRFKNFIASIGIGLGLLVTSVILLGFGWEHIYKMPYAFPTLSFMGMGRSDGTTAGQSFFLNHELNSIGYFVFFTALAFLDMRYRKERG